MNLTLCDIGTGPLDLDIFVAADSSFSTSQLRPSCRFSQLTHQIQGTYHDRSIIMRLNNAFRINYSLPLIFVSLAGFFLVPSVSPHLQQSFPFHTNPSFSWFSHDSRVPSWNIPHIFMEPPPPEKKKASKIFPSSSLSLSSRPISPPYALPHDLSGKQE